MTMVLFITGIGALIHLYAIGYMKGDEKFSKFFVYLNLFIFAMLMLVLGRQPAGHVPGLGRRRRLLVLPDLVLVHRPGQRLRRQEGLRHQPGRRLGLHGGDLPDVRRHRLDQLPRHHRLGQGRRDRRGHRHRHHPAAAGRRGRQVGPAAAVRVAARRHGRPHPGLRPHPRRHDGHRRRLPADPDEPGDRGLLRLGARSSSPGWGPSPRCSPPPPRWPRTTSRRSSPTPRSRSWATCSWRSAWAATWPAIFHMVTHAFFKALLFLAAGSVIHGMHHEQDMRRFGGLYKLLPVTCGVFIVGWLAIAGVPPFSGFWSKDEILAYAWDDNKVLWFDRPGRGAAHRLLHEPGHVPHVLRPLPLRGPHARRRSTRRGTPRSPPARRTPRAPRRRSMRPAPSSSRPGPQWSAARRRLRQGRGRGRGGPSARRRRSPWPQLQEARRGAGATPATTRTPRRRPRPPLRELEKPGKDLEKAQGALTKAEEGRAAAATKVGEAERRGRGGAGDRRPTPAGRSTSCGRRPDAQRPSTTALVSLDATRRRWPASRTTCRHDVGAPPRVPPPREPVDDDPAARGPRHRRHRHRLHQHALQRLDQGARALARAVAVRRRGPPDAVGRRAGGARRRGRRSAAAGRHRPRRGRLPEGPGRPGPHRAAGAGPRLVHRRHLRRASPAGPGTRPSRSTATFDRVVVDGSVNGVGRVVRWSRLAAAPGAERLRPLLRPRGGGRCGRCWSA